MKAQKKRRTASTGVSWAAAKAVMDSLEQRQLMAFSANITFAPSAATPVANFAVDSGKTYQAQNGLTYGWNTANTSDTRDRNASSDQLRDTLIHVANSDKWEMAVPNGTYSVRVVAGDPSYVDSKHVINVEGQQAVNFTPTSANKWTDVTKTVNVSDGKLTLTPGSGASNAKLNFLKITQTATGSGNGAGVPISTIPNTPSGLSVAAYTSSTVRLTWTDRSTNETGFEVRKSNNNDTWTLVNMSSANDNDQTVTGLTAGNRYYFRVRAVNGNDSSSWTTISYDLPGNGSTGNGGNTGGGTNNGGGSSSTGFGKGILDGIVANTSAAADPATIRGRLEDVGVKKVRLWYGVDNWTDGVDQWYVDRTAKWKAAGYTVMLAVVGEQNASYDTIKAFFNRLVSNSTLKNSVDLWQAGNEVNHAKYWYGTTSQYVNNYLRGAWDALHPKGEKVVGSGPTGDPNVATQLVSLGYNNYCDYAAFHPYAHTADEVYAKAAAAKAAYGNKPLIVTEWNLSGYTASQSSEWAAELNKAARKLAPLVHSAYFYSLVVEDHPYSKGGLLNNNNGYTPNSAFYNEYKSWVK